MAQFIPVRNLEALVARSAPVRENIAVRGARALVAAKAKLASRRDTGASRVTGRKAPEDYLLYLDDTRGDLAAHIIEFGLPGRQLPVRAISGAHVRRAAGGSALG